MTKTRNCEYCQDEIKDDKYYYIYSVGVDTDKSTHFVGLQKCMTDLSDYLMDKRVHLSASQIILFRPDIMKNFLQSIAGEETIKEFCLVKFVICTDCYEEYIQLVPLV